MKRYLFLIVVVPISFSSCTTKVVSTAPSNKVVVLKKVPRNHKVIVINGKKYYRWNDNYYRKTSQGYVIVRN